MKIKFDAMKRENEFPCKRKHFIVVKSKLILCFVNFILYKVREVSKQTINVKRQYVGRTVVV